MTGLSRLLPFWALCLISSGLPAAGAVPRALGTARALPAELMQQGHWRVEGDGSSVWSLKVESSGATALRVHLSGIQPSPGRLRFLAQDPGQPAAEVDLSRLSKESLWSASVEGSAIVIEYKVTGQSAGPLPFRIDALLPIHDEIGRQPPLRFWSQRSPEQEERGLLTVTAASPVDVQRPPANCQEDPRCSGTTYKAMTDAVAYYRYIDAGGVARACSGTLIRSRIPNAPPVFLTSGDCVKTQAEADTLEAWFQYRSKSCDLAPDSKPSGVKSNGAQLLVSRSGPEGNFSALHLDTVPPGVVPVEYALQAPGFLQPVYSVFHPVGSFQRLATGMASQLLESTSYYFDPAAYPDAAYQVIVFTLLGTMETGAEGAAIFDAGSRLVGTMALYPDAPCDLVQTTLMTKFSTIHAAIRKYLEESAENGSRGTLTATPNPLLLPENQSTGSVQLKWAAQNATAVQIRLNSPDGAPISGLLPPSGELQTPDWVSDGLEFFLQDASGGDSAGIARTLSSVRVTVRSGDPRVGRILANPNPAEAGTDRIDARVRLIWTAQNVDSVQIRMDGPDGPEVTGPWGLSGSFVVDGVYDGTVFYLQDRSSGDSAGAAKTLARVTVAVNSKVVPKGTLTAEPNPIVAPLSNLTGKVKLAWNATGVRFVEIRMNAPEGPALTGKVSPLGTLEVGFPVGPGTTFFLQDATRADSGSPARTLARLPILIIAEGPRSGVLSQSPTETQALPDRIDANVKLIWRATGVAQLAIRSGSSTGPLIADALAPLGEVLTAQPLSDGTQLFLQDATGGTSSGDARTLARLFVRVRSGLRARPSGTLTIDSATTSSLRTLRWTATNTTKVDIRMGDPCGALIVRSAPSSGQQQVSVFHGATFYLVDAARELYCGGDTLATVTVRYWPSQPMLPFVDRSRVVGRLWANPNPAPNAAGIMTGLYWETNAVASALILRSGSVGGNFIGEGLLPLSGSATVSGTIRIGGVSYPWENPLLLFDGANRSYPLASLWIESDPSVVLPAELRRKPNPRGGALAAQVIPSPDNSARMLLSARWFAGRNGPVRIGIRNGAAITGFLPASGSAVFDIPRLADSATLELWDEMPESNFERRDISSVSPQNWKTAKGWLRADREFVPLNETARLEWAATGVTRVQLRLNSPFGPVLGEPQGPSGGLATPPQLAKSTQFYLQDASSGNSEGPERTIATVWVGAYEEVPASATEFSLDDRTGFERSQRAAFARVFRLPPQWRGAGFQVEGVGFSPRVRLFHSSGATAPDPQQISSLANIRADIYEPLYLEVAGDQALTPRSIRITPLESEVFGSVSAVRRFGYCRFSLRNSMSGRGQRVWTTVLGIPAGPTSSPRSASLRANVGGRAAVVRILPYADRMVPLNQGDNDAYLVNTSRRDPGFYLVEVIPPAGTPESDIVTLTYTLQ